MNKNCNVDVRRLFVSYCKQRIAHHEHVLEFGRKHKMETATQELKMQAYYDVLEDIEYDLVRKP
jgi:hypothetical protein